MSERTLTTIDFHGATLVALRGETPETTMVAMKPVVEGMGLDWKSQHAKLVGHPVLSKGMVEITIPSLGGPQAMTALPLNRLNFWLATIQPNKVPGLETRARVIEYQTECADALFDHFFGKVVAAGPHLTAGQFGGIAKAVVGKALAEHKVEVMRAVVEIVRQELGAYAAPSGHLKTSVEFVPALTVIDEAAVPQKGRGGLVRKASNALSRFCHRRGLVVRAEAHTDRRLFHVDAVAEWLKEEGMHMIRAHLDKLAGQSIMQFPKSRRLRSVPASEKGTGE